MGEIKMNDPDLREIASALRYLAGRDEECSTNRRKWGEIAAAIEEQVKPAIEEPLEFGSVVIAAARLGNRMRWQRTPMHGKHYWESETGDVDVWSELGDPEVLRIGVGEPEPRDEWRALDIANAQEEAYSRGYEEGVQSNLPSPVDRSNINSALREAIAAINLREARLIVEGDSYELADAVMKHLLDGSDESSPDPEAYAKGVQETVSKIHGHLQLLRAEAITSERKNAYDVAIKTVEAMQP